ncbi:aminopeptidase O [Willisornis vidua]|uniref:Aminopeptidase O n=1 Tax=Willisornis vidua TaxID=1566151 RepID=A0ABQ9CQT2_9PASS|nr:aminopeptidase O [Willisornis vidua]
METQLDPMKDDLPLMANTSYMLVKHYVLDLDVDFKSKVIEGSIVLFFEPGSRYRKTSSTGKECCQSHFDESCKIRAPEPCHIPMTNVSASSSKKEYNDFAVSDKGEEDTSDENGSHSNSEQASGISSSKDCCDIENHGNKDFLLVLDCCDLSVLKVEEVDVTAVSGTEKFTRSAKLTDVLKEPKNLRNQIVHKLVTLPADRWKEQLYYFTLCSQAPACGELLFTTGPWSLEIRKSGIQTPTDFPHAIRIWYKTKPDGRSITWATDQSGRPCVYTMGSPINNRALFPCQEPPIALSTWQASVRTAAGFVVLMSGENSAEPVQLQEGILSWYYYVSMPMPASTFTIAVGCWQEVKQQSFSAAIQTNTEFFLPSSQTDSRHVAMSVFMVLHICEQCEKTSPCWVQYSSWGYHQSTLEVGNHLPQPAGHTCFDAAQGALGFVGCMQPLMSHVELLITVLNPFPAQPVSMFGIALTQVQEVALGLVEHHDFHSGLPLKPVKVPLDGNPSLQHVNCTTQLGVVAKFAAGALDPTGPVPNKDVTQCQYPYLSLRRPLVTDPHLDIELLTTTL